jgi:hypothetical protein
MLIAAHTLTLKAFDIIVCLKTSDGRDYTNIGQWLLFGYKSLDDQCLARKNPVNEYLHP